MRGLRRAVENDVLPPDQIGQQGLVEQVPLANRIEASISRSDFALKNAWIRESSTDQSDAGIRPAGPDQIASHETRTANDQGFHYALIPALLLASIPSGMR